MKQTTGVFAVLTAALFLGSMAGVGCGGDDDTTGGTGGSGGSAGATGGKAGSGGSGGATGGTGGTAGSDGGAGKAGGDGAAGSAGSDGGSDAPTTVTCGTRTCNPIPGTALGTLAACCPMGEMNACGGVVSLAGNACITTTAGTPDSSCPSIAAMVMLPGCCRPNGMCGVNVSALSLGCADPTPLGGMGNIPCGGDSGRPDTGTPDTGTPDTGTPDTGTPDTGTPDTGTPDTGTPDTGTPDTGTPDTGTPDTGGDTGTGDTGSDTGTSDAPADAPTG